MISRMIQASLAFALGTFASNALAGNSLFFKSGTINTSSISTSLKNQLSQLAFSDRAGQTNYHVVQFVDGITMEDRETLESLGAKVLRYIPDDAFLVELGGNLTVQSLSREPAIKAVVPYIKEFKLSHEFGKLKSVSTYAKVIVRFFNEGEAFAAAKALELKVLHEKGNFLIFEGNINDVKAIAAWEGVEWVQPLPNMQTLEFDVGTRLTTQTLVPFAAVKTIADLTGFESGTKLMNFDAAWARGYDGTGQLVGFSDTGLDSGKVSSLHRDFTNNVLKGYGYGLFSFGFWGDPMGHGTHVAGSVASNGSASNGVLKGGAYASKLIAGGMWSKLINNMFPPQDIGKMFTDAYADGARVHTNSWGSAQSLGAYDQFAQTVDKVMWDNPELLILFAAGNSGVDSNKDGRVDTDSIGSPATAKNVLSVGASENFTEGGINKEYGDFKDQQGNPRYGADPIASDKVSDDGKGIAAFSSRGPTDDGRLKPEVVAPGTNILSVKSQDKDAKDLWGAFNADYTWSGGTSMSTPLVAGAASVLRQYFIQNRGMARPSAAVVKAALMHTATDLYPGQYGSKGKAGGQELLKLRPNNNQGFGLVNMDRATQMDSDLIVDELSGVGSGETRTFTMEASSSTELMLTLVYTDAPGAASAAKALVNDLDVVITQNGQTIAAASDRINNHEYLKTQVQAGKINIEVKGYRVVEAKANGKLPFAFVASLESGSATPLPVTPPANGEGAEKETPEDDGKKDGPSLAEIIKKILEKIGANMFS